MEGQSVLFTCLVAGYPEPKVDFYRDGKKLKQNERISIGTGLWYD